MKNGLLLLLLFLVCLSKGAIAVEYRPQFSEFILTYPAQPELKSVKQNIDGVNVPVDMIVADFVAKDGYLKAEFIPVKDPNYLQSMTREAAMQTLENYARSYAIRNAAFSASQRGAMWVAEAKGLWEKSVGGKKLTVVYKMTAYYGRKSILIQHALADVKDYPTQAVMNFLNVRFDSR